MSSQDLDTALDTSLSRNNAVMINFWRHFCDDEMRTIVRGLMAGEPATRSGPLLRLIDCGFVTETEDGPKLRVPLFEIWIERHGESFG